MVRPERGTTWASSLRGNVEIWPPLLLLLSSGCVEEEEEEEEEGSDLTLTGRAPRESGLKRPPWVMTWSWDLKCVSCGAHEVVREVKSRGASGSGCGALLSLLDDWEEGFFEDGGGDDDGEDVEGLFCAGAILRFLCKGTVVVKVRMHETVIFGSSYRGRACLGEKESS